MSRTLPKLIHLHPTLRRRLEDAAEQYVEENPERRLVLEYGFRTLEEQQKAYARKRTKLNGRTRFSRHNYGSENTSCALAADVHIHRVDTIFTWLPLYEDNLPDVGIHKLILIPQGGTQKERKKHSRQIHEEYRVWGRIAEKHDLFSGIMNWGWDGPHVELGKKDRVIALQEALVAADYPGMHPGPVDGIMGKKTLRAVNVAALEAKTPTSKKLSWAQRRSFPVHPDTWTWLHR
jgi:hypothetical protein